MKNFNDDYYVGFDIGTGFFLMRKFQKLTMLFIRD